MEQAKIIGNTSTADCIYLVARQVDASNEVLRSERDDRAQEASENFLDLQPARERNKRGYK